jgi:hypothetical protein
MAFFSLREGLSTFQKEGKIFIGGRNFYYPGEYNM